MTSPSLFQNVICDQPVNVQEILSCLDDLPHLIYLKNNQSPVIAFLPNQFECVKNGVRQTYQRTQLDQYISIESSLSFKQSENNQSNSDGFQGGLMGFISYDFASAQHVKVHSKDQPSFWLGLFQTYLKFQDDAWYFYSDEPEAEQIFAFIQNKLESTSKVTPLQLTQTCQARWNKQQYQHAFTQVQEYIKAGDCYQINLTQEFSGQAEGRLLSVAQEFWQLTDAPYSGYLKTEDFELLSCSPELFIEFLAEKKLVTKPIKGTMPRYADAARDAQSKHQLQHSPKDQAENVMIVDLLRNDLSVYAETGTVKTPKLFEIESFNQVHHMVSEVTATLKPDVKALDVLLAALPGGSITGAPKIRAMQIIEELEGAPRGAYCGSLGYFNFDGTGSWNILIRSIQKYQQDISLWAGGGITIASDCDAEYQECFDKVSAMLDLLNTWQKPQS
ncbi:aminodeoxychorismate synthase component I [Acinetobacter sp. AM]|uniref:aminodeoxychorismate synthase component I n=1 Tax=Acinetobacter sp. AM TaxID=2170730 RepID=UPI000DE65FF9|nr:aminodeoxychorismate synthase component I [Acinetobacter sp. AM]PWB13533.1 aminodeoxychorismate synthase component I [Acinetobacter sp. AM]